jgi:hypothetical protein
MLSVTKRLQMTAKDGGLKRRASDRASIRPWKRSREDFLVPVRALSVIFRAKFRDLLKKTELFDQVDRRVWKKEWVVHSEPVVTGEAVFKYLAPYVFRVAISNNRILKLEDGRVTFKYKPSATDQVKFATVSGEEFISTQISLRNSLAALRCTRCWVSWGLPDYCF